MVTSVTFLEDFRCFKKGDVIPFKPGINLLVGDQGCGKSTLLLILKDDGYISPPHRYAHVEAPKGTQSYFLDFETGGVRNITDANQAAHMGISLGAVISSKWMSHGESVNIMLEHMPKKSNAVMLNDEPDMALSMRSIRKFYEMLKHRAEEYGQQIICSCHNPYMMELVGEVYSLEHRRHMTYEEFKQLMEKD